VSRPLPPAAHEIELNVRARQPLVYVVTWEEERAIELLAGVAERSGRRLFVWTQTRGLGPARGGPWDARLADPLAVLDHIANSDARALYTLLDLHPFLASHTVVRKLKDTAALVAGSAKNVVLVSPVLTLPPDLAKQVAVVDLPLPRPEEIAHALDAFVARAAAGAGVRVTLGEAERELLVRSAQGLTLAELAAALGKAIVARNAVDAGTIELVHAEKQQIIRKTGVLESVPAGEGLDAVGGLDALKRWLEARAGAFTERARRFGLPVPKGLLLVGVQGAGKSLCARSAAAAWRLPLLRLDVGAIFAGTVGASEANLRQAMALAESVSPCVLWVDEIERGFSGVDGSAASDAGTAARVFGTFLTWLQEKQSPVFVIATANAIESLPPELVRKGRFDEIFFVDLPGPAERLEIVRIHLHKRHRDPAAFDLEALAEASEGFSGAEIEQAIIAALFYAFEDDRKLETRDVLRALRETVPLSRTMSERLDALRAWAQHRARPASTSGLAAGRRVTV
jgi:SpoVK/Ycf46/Vps4 family AAA+-type ATPase